MRRYLALPAAVLIAAALVVGVAAVLDPGVRERLSGDTVEGRIGDYLRPLMAGDPAGALRAWQLVPGRPNETAIAARRESVTAAIRELALRRFQIEHVHWWRTCCEPAQLDDDANAGLGRAVVRFDTDGGSQRYIFDVLARETVYWGDAAGSPPHNWTLRDVYPAGDAPLFASFASATARHPDVVAVVREFHDRYGEALVTCDVRKLWDRFPALATGQHPSRGINSEGVHIAGLCGMRIAAARFELEAYEPMQVHEHPGGVDVTVHGVERFALVAGKESAGEFKKTFTLRRAGRSWEVARTDEVTLAEWHQLGR